MIRTEVKVRTLTPVWTGGADGAPAGLKLSGVLGSMRMVFEALVREAGGHTCDITGSADHRCNYAQDQAVCPACAIFGCTGLSRAFKLDWSLPSIGNILLPVADTEAEYTNRSHDGTHYCQKNGQEATLISKWLEATVSADKELAQDTRPGDWNARVRPAYSPDVSIITATQLRGLSGEADLMTMVRGLLVFMARKYGIGAKVNQGWGVFSVEDDKTVKIKELKAEVEKLVRAFPYHSRYDAGMMSASDFGVYPYTSEMGRAMPFSVTRTSGGGTAPLVDNFGFEWRQDPSRGTHFISVGYALKYRLRRMVKFAKKDSGQPELDEVAKLADQWAEQNDAQVRSYKNVPWKKNGAFAEYLFGAAAKVGDDHYGAGLIGVSHLYRRSADEKWSMRMLTQCSNDDYNDAVNKLLFLIITEASNK